MKKIVLFPILGLGIIALTLVGFSLLKKRYFPYYFVKNELQLRDSEPVIAVYDPFKKIPKNNMKHYALVIKADSDWNIEKNDLTSIDQDEPVIVTVEIFGKQILNRIAHGKFNDHFRKVLSKTVKDRKNIYLRILPEMEQNDKNYPWTNWGFVYNAAFKTLSNVAREEVPQAKILWGPSGYPGNMEYYPKHQTIDAASITINHSTKGSDLEDQIIRQLLRMRFLKTPIFLMGKKELSKGELSSLFARFEKEKTQIDFKYELDTNLTDYNRKNEVRIGVYDPQKSLVNKDEISAEHLFINFEDIRNGSMLKSLKSILSRGHDAIITLEPEGKRKILEQIHTGKFDTLIKGFYNSIPETDQMIFLRFAQEMEIPVDRYAWQEQDPIDYIKAYRYIVKFPDSTCSRVKTIWGPAGDRGSLDWWPGSDVVDFISMSVYGLPDKNITDPAKQESFESIYTRKKRRLDFFHKPIFITEFGVKGSDEFQQNWLQNAAQVINADKNIFGVSYFNYHDVQEAWGNINPPDWRISNKTFDAFTERLD